MKEWRENRDVKRDEKERGGSEEGVEGKKIRKRKGERRERRTETGLERERGETKGEGRQERKRGGRREEDEGERKREGERGKKKKKAGKERDEKKVAQRAFKTHKREVHTEPIMSAARRINLVSFP